MADEDIRPFPHFATNALHAGQDPWQWESRAIVPPLSLSTTFAQRTPGQPEKYEYSRSNNPTRDVAEKCLASLEDGKYCMLLASGLAATTTTLHLLKAGDHMVSHNDVYGGTNRYFRKVVSTQNIDVTFVDATNPDNVRNAIKPNTKIVWMETPTNPLMQIIDIAKVSKTVKDVSEDIILVVDNTFATPYFQRPLTLGADVVLHSLSKYINGHTDVIGGALITSRDDIHERLRFLQNAIGTILSPFDSYLVNRGMKTLHLRMQAHHKNATALAKFLEADPRVDKVVYPGLESHPQHELAKKQMRGFSGMITFFIKGGLAEAKTFLETLKIFVIAESLGGYESLAEHPAIMTHASICKEERESLGISDTLIRLSVGVEDSEDLIADVAAALAAAHPNIKA